MNIGASPERNYAETSNAPQREREVPAALSNLSNALDRLEGAVARLDPLVGPEQPANPVLRDGQTKCPLAERLDQLTAQVRGLTAYVERVEI